MSRSHEEHYDVVVIGAGPAGLAAARVAAKAGARVAVLDDNPRAGGQVWRNGPLHPPSAALADHLTALGDTALWSSTRVIAPLGRQGLLVESAERGGVRFEYEKLILATGARERLLPFAGWTLPGVTGAGGLQALVKGGVPVRGERIVIAGSGPLLLASLATARAAGAEVVAVVEQASWASLLKFGASLVATPSKLWQAAQLTGGFTRLAYRPSSIVREARGDGRVEQVVIARADGRTEVFAVERVACGYGLVPNVTLAQALGCAIDGDDAIGVDGMQRTSIGHVFAAGECTGVGGMELAQVEGQIAGYSAVDHIDQALALQATRARWQRFARRVDTAFALGDLARTLPPDPTLLCRCEDVPIGDVRVYANWRDAKLQTRCGMGACQGRICASAAQTYFGWDVTQVRPPCSPAQIGTLMAVNVD